jgi:hypothetical protein
VRGILLACGAVGNGMQPIHKPVTSEIIVMGDLGGTLESSPNVCSMRVFDQVERLLPRRGGVDGVIIRSTRFHVCSRHRGGRPGDLGAFA